MGDSAASSFRFRPRPPTIRRSTRRRSRRPVPRDGFVRIELTVDRLDAVVRELVDVAERARIASSPQQLESARPQAAEDIARRILSAVDLN